MTKQLNQKIIASLMVFFFLTSGPVFSQQSSAVSEPVSGVGQGIGRTPAGVPQVDAGAPAIRPDLNPYNITVPEEFGKVEEIFQGAPTSPLIVYIQNVHANYEAQLNIKGILKHLVDQNQFSLIQLEGAVSKLNPEILQPSYLKEANLKLVDFLMREGRITGADAFAVETDKPVELYGIEDYSLYMENLKMFKAVYQHQQEMSAYFDEMHRLIQNIGPKLLSPELLDFTRKTEEFSTDKIDILDYLLYMNKLSEAHKLVSLSDMKEIVDYPNLVRLMRLHNLEEQLNKGGLKKETEALKLEFRKKMSGSEKVEKILTRLDDNAKGVNPRSYFLELTELADQAKIDFASYPAFRIFAEFLIHQDEIDHRGLFSELKQFEAYLQGQLFTKENEKGFLEMIDYLGLLEQYFRLEMSREKLALYLKDRDNIKPSWILAHLEQLAGEYQIPVKFTGDIKKLDSYMDELEYFYQLVLKRDEIFTEKIFRKMKSLQQDKTIVVTGGFHKDALMDHFRKSNVSYVIISPKVDVKEGNENYLKVMLDQDAVVGSVFAGTFALEKSNYGNPGSKLALAQEVLGPGVSATQLVAGEKFAIGEARGRFDTIANQTGVSFILTGVDGSGLTPDHGAEARFFNTQGQARRAELRGSVNTRTGQFLETIVSERSTNSRDLERAGIIRPRVLPQGVNRAELRDLNVSLSNVRPSTIASVKESFTRSDLLLGGLFLPPNLPVAEQVKPVVEALLKLTPAAQSILAITPSGSIFTLDGIKQAQRTANVGGVSIEAENAPLLSKNEQKFFDSFFSNSTVPQDTIFLVLVLDTQNQVEASRAKLRAIVTSLKANQNLAVAAYGVGINNFAKGALDLPNQEALRREPFNRILFVEQERNEPPVTTFEGAVALATRHAASKVGLWLNHFRSTVPPAVSITSPEELMRVGGVHVPAGEIGLPLRNAITQRWSSDTIQLFELDTRNTEVNDLRAIRDFEVKVLSRLRQLGAAALLKELGQVAIQQIAPNQWQISGTAAALNLIRRLYQAYVRLEIAA